MSRTQDIGEKPSLAQEFLGRHERLRRGASELDINLPLVSALEIFNRQLNPLMDVIYYPGSGKDNAPSKAFPNKRVIYVDTDQKAIEALKYDGYEAHWTSADTYDPGLVDLVILSLFHSDKPLEFVTPGGYVISSDWWRTADKIARRQDFEIVGVLQKNNKSQDYFMNTENPNKYLEYVETDEELKEQATKNGTLNYIKEAIQRLSKKKEEDMLLSYREILEDFGKNQEEIKLVDPTGRVLFPIPRKLRLEEGFFVFRKRPFP